MSDEFKLRQAASRGSRAKTLLENELLAEAFERLEESYVAAWRSTTIDDSAGREKLFLAINIVGKVRQHLATALTNGKVADVELQQLARTAEAKPRWQDIP